MEKTYLSADEVADLLGTTRGNIYLMCREGRLPFVKRGRRTLFPIEAWKQFVVEQSTTAMSALSNP